MLQFIAEDNDNYSIPEQVQMAIEGGCRWIVLNVPLKEDSEIRDIAGEIIPICRENETLLTIVGHVALAKDMQIHGVLLTKDDMSMTEAREFCGPEAIIGVMIDKPADLLPLAKTDLDYAAFPRDTTLPYLAGYVKAIRDGGIILPLVAYGDYDINELNQLMDTGISGLALAHTITDSLDPADTTKRILADLKNRKK